MGFLLSVIRSGESLTEEDESAIRIGPLTKSRTDAACLALALEALAAYANKDNWDIPGIIWVGGPWPTKGWAPADVALAKIKEMQEGKKKN
jgi:hypothetical protein